MRFEVWFVKRNAKYRNVEILDKRDFEEWLENTIKQRLKKRLFGFLLAGLEQEIVIEFQNLFHRRLRENRNRRRK